MSANSMKKNSFSSKLSGDVALTCTSTSNISLGLIWFGAAISMSEILTGTLLAPLGFTQAMTASLIGHAIGCALFFLAGLIGAKTKKSSMQTVSFSFGRYGSVAFSIANVLQLIGWTAVMIISGKAAANAIVVLGFEWGWTLVIGLLIALWILVGIKNLPKINAIAVGALFIVTVMLSLNIFSGASLGISQLGQGGISFASAIELSIAMPLSWLPLVSDYTRHAKSPLAGSAVATVVYGVGSIWMYAIGIGMAIFAGSTDIGEIMLAAGMGIAGLIIILLSTVTTTFLDVYSAGVSAVNICSKISEKAAGLIVCAIGTFLAVFVGMAQYEVFLLAISSIFAPMIAILVANFFILKRDVSSKKWDVRNSILWIVGFGVHRLFLGVESPVGSTLPVMVIIIALCIVVNLVLQKLQGQKC